jgi:hypothetical protein
LADLEGKALILFQGKLDELRQMIQILFHFERNYGTNPATCKHFLEDLRHWTKTLVFALTFAH